MNCSLVTKLNDELIFAFETNVGFSSTIAFLAIVSFIIILFGNNAATPLTAILSLGVTVFAVYDVSDIREIPCLARLLGSAVSAVLAALISVCLLRWGLFLLGALCFGFCAHILYLSMPPEVEPPNCPSSSR